MNQDVFNTAVFNKQSLDTWGDIIVSFEYERFNYNNNFTGGFTVSLFDSIINLPKGGGPGSSLGYAPSTEIEYCKRLGYEGLQGAFLGIGFDSDGIFAAELNGRNGIPLSAINNEPTITVRGGVQENYQVLGSINLTKTLTATRNSKLFLVNQVISANETPQQNSVRIILTNHATLITVQLKADPDKEEFDTLLEIKLPEKVRKSLRVALTNTSNDNLTNFNIKNFNVAGFPGTVTKQRIDKCSKVVTLPNYGLASEGRLCTGEEFFVTSVPNRILTYTTDTVNYNLKNTIFTGSGIQITTSAENYVGVIYLQKSLIGIFKYLGEKLARDFFIIPPDSQLPKWVDIGKNSKNIAILTRPLSGTVFIYEYIDNSINSEEIGTWRLYQTLNYNAQLHGNAGFFNKVKISDRNLAINTGNQSVHMYRKNIANVWEYIQTLSAVIAPEFITGFGEELVLNNNDLIVGAPQSQKTLYPEPTQGEVYHYVYSETRNKWELAMALGSFFGVNTPLGNFGASIDFDGTTCVVGSPGEEYRTPNITVPNVGRIHVFRKQPTGIFTQGVSLAPEQEFITRNAFFGSNVSLTNNYLYVFSPFTRQYNFSQITVFDLNCTFDTPPPQINIPACALITFDNKSFILDSVTDTYMLSYTCQLRGGE